MQRDELNDGRRKTDHGNERYVDAACRSRG